MTLQSRRLQPKNIDDIDWKVVQYQYSYRSASPIFFGALLFPLVLGPWLIRAWIFPAMIAVAICASWYFFQCRMKVIHNLFDHGKSRTATVTNIRLSKRGGYPNRAKPTVITVEWRECNELVSSMYEVSPYHEIDERKLERNVTVLTLPNTESVIIADLFKF